jgi:hypothetical protein
MTPDDLPPLLAIKALVAGDKHPRWSDDWATGSTRSRILDIINAAEAAIEADRKKRGEPVKLPFRKSLERLLDDAEHPKGMSIHDGKAHVPADWIRYLLKRIDYAAPPVDPEKRERALAIADIFEREAKLTINQCDPFCLHLLSAAALLREAYL